MPHRQLGVISALIIGLLGPLMLSDLVSLRGILSAFLLPLFLFLRRTRGSRCVGLVLLTFLSGFSFSSYQLNKAISQQLDPSLEGRDLWLQGTIEQSPRGSDTDAAEDENSFQYVRFEMRVHALEIEEEAGVQAVNDLHGAKVRLSWRRSDQHAQVLRAGQTWRLLVRLKTPRGFVNPKGFDYQAWLLAKNIMASGYVKQPASALHELIAEKPPGVFESAREFLFQRLFQGNDHELVGILQALLIGDRARISKAQWQVFRDTGTSHLMAISGLHIGLVAVFGFWWCRRFLCPLLVFRISYFSNRAAAIFMWLPALVSVFLAGAYAGLSGFSIPTQRAWLIVVLANFAILIGRRCDGIYLLLCVAALILVLNPMAATQTGFWLSFTAVFFLLFCFAYKANRRNGLWDILRAQLIVFVGLAAVLSALSISVSAVSPLANIIAVPLMSLVIIPLLLLAALISVFSAEVASQLLEGILALCDLLWQFLTFLAVYNRPFSISHEAIFLILCVLASLAFLSTPSLNLRIAGIAMAALAVFGQSNHKAELELSVLDVGQGLSIVVREAETSWVYDTGARFSKDFDIGSAVLVPFLRSQGVSTLDTVVISHGDNDHLGGLASLAEALTVKHLIYNQDYAPLDNRSSCYRRQTWQITDTQIEALWPPRKRPTLYQELETGPQDEKPDNNESCVLLIRHGDFTALLSGDIEKSVEQALLKDPRLPRNIDLLIAPHHGSRSSSSPEFISHLAPAHVVFSAGYKNRYGHPAPDIVDRYVRRGVQIWRTDRDGAIILGLAKGRLIVDSQRRIAKRPWFRHPGAEN